MGGTVLNPLFTLEYTVLVALVVIATGVLLAWRTSAKCRPGVRWTIVGARALALIGLTAIALNPGTWRHERFGKERETAILVDRTLSMATADMAGRTRWNDAVRLAGRVVAASEQKERVRIFTFTDRLENSSVEDLIKRTPDGEPTDIVQAGKALLTRYRSGDRTLSGVILLSDGRQVLPARAADLALDCRAQESPIFALALGGDVARRDLSITSARRQYVAFAGQKLKIGGLVKNEGLGNISVQVQLLDAAGAALSEQKVDVADGQTVPVSFEVVPDKRGYYEYVMKVPAWQGEASGGNNQSAAGVAALESKMRVFVAEGVPGWDSKFLVQLLRKQANMEVTSVYRLSSDRFFKVETDLTKVAESSESLFPDTAEALSAYDLLVFGKGVDYFLTPERIRLVRNFVSDQGGCVIFSRGKPYSSHFPDLEFLEPLAWGEPVGTPFRFRPVRSGESAGLFGDMLAGVADPVWAKLPLLQSATRSEGLKAFSQVLAEGVFEAGEGKDVAFPLVVSRRFGKGMVVLMNAEGLWQWDFFPSVKEASNMYQDIWSQLLQWAVTYSEFLPGQEYSMRLTETATLPGVPVTVRIARRGTAGKSATPVLRVYLDQTRVQELTAAPVADMENRWAAVLAQDKPGIYRIELAESDKGAALGPCSMLQVQAPLSEKDNLSADRAFLENLAHDSGGSLVTADQLETIVAQLGTESEPADAGKTLWTPRWDRAWLLLLILFFFGAECFVRRRNGLL